MLLPPLPPTPPQPFAHTLLFTAAAAAVGAGASQAAVQPTLVCADTVSFVLFLALPHIHPTLLAPPPLHPPLLRSAVGAGAGKAAVQPAH
jgi:hypothetical protein